MIIKELVHNINKLETNHTVLAQRFHEKTKQLFCPFGINIILLVYIVHYYMNLYKLTLQYKPFAYFLLRTFKFIVNLL